MVALTVQQALPALKAGWLIAVCVGVIANILTLREAWIDYRFVKRCRRDEAAHVQAWTSLRDQIVSLTFQSGVLYMRAWALLWPDPGDARFAYNWAADATVLTALQLLLAYNCLLDNRDRRRTIHQLQTNPGDGLAAAGHPDSGPH